MRHILLWTDGSYRRETGMAGYANLMYCDGHACLSYDPEVENSTINRMELTAALNALDSIQEPCEIDLYSDSAYVVNGLKYWIHDWVKRGWVSSTRKPVKNQDLWERLYAKLNYHIVHPIHVKAHTKRNDLLSTGNRLVDSFAFNGGATTKKIRI